MVRIELKPRVNVAAQMLLIPPRGTGAITGGDVYRNSEVPPGLGGNATRGARRLLAPALLQDMFAVWPWLPHDDPAFGCFIDDALPRCRSDCQPEDAWDCRSFFADVRQIGDCVIAEKIGGEPINDSEGSVVAPERVDQCFQGC